MVEKIGRHGGIRTCNLTDYESNLLAERQLGIIAIKSTAFASAAIP